MMILCKNWYFSVQKAIIYYTFNKSHHNSFILLVFSHVANFRYVANLRFLTLYTPWTTLSVTVSKNLAVHAHGETIRGENLKNFKTSVTYARN